MESAVKWLLATAIIVMLLFNVQQCIRNEARQCEQKAGSTYFRGHCIDSNGNID